MSDDTHELGSTPSERAQRLSKIEQLRSAGVDPYPVRFDRDLTLGELRARFGDLAPDTEPGDRVKVAGRLMLIRRQGGLSFAELRDRSGHVQLFVDTHVVGADQHHSFDHLDRGDIVGVEGTVMTTHTGELSVKVDSFQLLSKGLRPLPEKGKPLTDLETRYRQRYVDLIVNDRTLEIFEIRIKAIDAIRQHLREQGFWEVETPVLQSIQGGATARPFITHHNALDIDLYLRIALELHLKRLIVGGMERVFEMSRVFRNEGIDHRHNPEFTEIEVYQAYADYNDMMDLTEALFRASAQAALGTTVVTIRGQQVDLAQPFKRVTMVELIKDKVGVDINPAMPVEDARKVLDGLGVPYENDWGAGKMTDEVYDRFVEAQLTEPTFTLDHPREVSPLARTHRSDPTLVERFELVIGGTELANAYSELNDPVDQLERFQIEARNKAAGDAEAGDVDLDYVRALEYAMPPTGGLGIGVDRLVMLLAGVDSIREVLLFPTLRPEAGEGPPRGPAPRHRHVPDEHASVVAAVAEAAASAAQAAGDAEQATVPDQVATTAPRRPTAVRVVTALTVVGGILSLVPVLPLIHAKFSGLSASFGPLWFQVTGHVASVLLGAALLLLARELYEQKQRAWEVALGAFAALVVIHAVKGFHPVVTGYCLAMLALLVATRHYFRAPADPPSLFSVVRFVPIYFGAVFIAGYGALFVERNQIDPDYTFGNMATTVLKGLVGVSGDYVYHRPLFARYYPAALLALGIGGLVWAAVLIFRPLAARREHTEDDWLRARRLVRTYGWDTLAYFSLRDDKSFFFSSDGEAMLAYTYLRGHGLVSGDPIGAPGSISLVLDEFLEFCRERAWTPAFLAVREHDLPLYTARGFHHVYLGDEAIIHCDAFSLEGKKMKGVRQAVARVERNYEYRLMRESDVPPALIDALNAISERWRGKKPERGFTMSLSQDCKGESDEFLIGVALDAHGKAGGFLRFVPAFGTDFGYTLDLMRHDPDAPNGMTEFLISKTALALKDEGVVRLSMNFAAWGRLFEVAPSSVAQRVFRWGVELLNPFFQVKSLHDFNAKFSPEWLPRVIVFPRRADLGQVATLYAGVEGFLALPVIGELFVPKALGGASSPDEVALRSA